MDVKRKPERKREMCEWAVESERQGDAGGRKRGLIKCESSCTLFLAKPWKCWNERALNLDSSFLTFLWLAIHAWQQVDRILGEKAMGTVRPGGRHLTQHSTQLEPISVPAKLSSSIYCPRKGEDWRGGNVEMAGMLAGRYRMKRKHSIYAVLMDMIIWLNWCSQK